MSARRPAQPATPSASLRSLTPAHADEIAPLLWDERVANMLAVDRRPPAWGSTPEELAVIDEHWRTFGFGLWILRDRRTGAMVGRGGLQHTLATGEPEVEIAWAIVPERWREGLATELALACIDSRSGSSASASVSAYTRPENFASRAVMKKAGMSFERVVHRPPRHPRGALPPPRDGRRGPDDAPRVRRADGRTDFRRPW